jgi:glycosyltransferase involved in cell wall biosynthesis
VSGSDESPVEGTIDVSVVCAVRPDTTDLAEMHAEIRRELAQTGRAIEFLYILPGRRAILDEQIARLEDPEGRIRVLRLARDFGEATALQVGFEHSRGKYVLTVPDRRQTDASVVREILTLLDDGHEVVVVRRDPRKDGLFNRLQSRVFHALTKALVWENLRDITCGVRGLTRKAAVRLDLYGDQHRFVPILARRSGYEVLEIPSPQHPANRTLRLFGPGVYVRRILDIFSIFFLARFTRKPLRFFGLIGSVMGMIGFAICLVLAYQRLFGKTALADRPLLLLGVLLLVLGVQVISLGLLGEVIIFLSSRRETPMVREVTDPESSARPRP